MSNFAFGSVNVSVLKEIVKDDAQRQPMNTE